MLEIINYIVAIGSILVGLWGIEVLLLRTKAGAHVPVYRDFIEKRTLMFGVLVSWATVLGSLYYSMVVGYEPCAICWWIRIFLYSIAVLLLHAMHIKDLSVFKYVKVLSVIGAFFAIYIQLMVWFPGSGITCSTAELCLREYVKVFGFVTIPLMSFCAFVFLFALSVFADKKHKDTV